MILILNLILCITSPLAAAGFGMLVLGIPYRFAIVPVLLSLAFAVVFSNREFNGKGILPFIAMTLCAMTACGVLFSSLVNYAYPVAPIWGLVAVVVQLLLIKRSPRLKHA